MTTPPTSRQAAAQTTSDHAPGLERHGTRVHRIEVRTRPGRPDPRASKVRRDAEAYGLRADAVATAKVYLIEAALSDPQLESIKARLLADRVTESASVGVLPSGRSDDSIVEVHPLPGVMDPAAQSVRAAIRDLIGVDATVSTGERFDFHGPSAEAVFGFAGSQLANPVIQQITRGPWQPDRLPTGHPYAFKLRHIPIRDLTDEQLARMSRDAHLFLSPDEMRAVQSKYRELGREPTDIELETIAQTWSEHCVHKTLKSNVTYRCAGAADSIDWAGRPGVRVEPDGSVTISNLLKSTVAAATHELIAEGIDWTLSVFKDNSGVIALNDDWGVNIKVETHNRPSAIEPYGGAATGAGGCIRDVIGTGLGARPIANTDVFCVANPNDWASPGRPEGQPLPPGTLHPRRILAEVVAGVRDYGNRMGIPTVNGAVSFDNRYVGNPLVYCGCIGILPRHLVSGSAKPGDRIIAIGGRTGRDGIHGATFSSAELESSAASEFAHAVQIGNAIEEKRVLETIIRARDSGPGSMPLFNAITDCGAGGFSSAVGEMGGSIGAAVTLDTAPLKYAGLSYTEIWISEAQERMILAVPRENLPALQRICDEEQVELADLGRFGTPGVELVLTYGGLEVGRLPMHFLHDGIPMPTRQAVWDVARPAATGAALIDSTNSTSPPPTIANALKSLLGDLNIASKHWIIRQYDHEVQGNTVLKPLVGPGRRGPGDASILQPIHGQNTGVAIACGLQTAVGDPAIGGDSYQMALAAIDECVRNLVCVGADPRRIAILDNFCWPSCDKPANMGHLVRACAGCYDGAKAYRTPFVSGKDSLNNQLRYNDPATGRPQVIEIPPTLLITGLSVLDDIDRAITMDAKRPGNVLLLVGDRDGPLGGSTYGRKFGGRADIHSPAYAIPAVDLQVGPRTAAAVADVIAQGLALAAHDCSEGGLLVALAEMLIATDGAATGPLGFDMNPDHVTELTSFAFNEAPCRYVLEAHPRDLQKINQILASGGLREARLLGTLTPHGRLQWPAANLDLAVEDLADAWLRPLDW